MEKGTCETRRLVDNSASPKENKTSKYGIYILLRTTERLMFIIFPSMFYYQKCYCDAAHSAGVTARQGRRPIPLPDTKYSKICSRMDVEEFND
jgi:hypothetical protein